jgi:hypothetical protein
MIVGDGEKDTIGDDTIKKPDVDDIFYLSEPYICIQGLNRGNEYL